MSSLPRGATPEQRAKLDRFNSVFYGKDTMGDLNAANHYADTGQRQPPGGGNFSAYTPGGTNQQTQGGAYSAYSQGSAQGHQGGPSVQGMMLPHQGQSQQEFNNQVRQHIQGLKDRGSNPAWYGFGPEHDTGQTMQGGAYSAYRPGQAQPQQSPYATSTSYGQSGGQQGGWQQQMPSFQFSGTDFMGNTYSNPAAFTAQQGAMALALNQQRQGMLGQGQFGSLNPQVAYNQGMELLQQGWQNPFAQQPQGPGGNIRDLIQEPQQGKPDPTPQLPAGLYRPDNLLVDRGPDWHTTYYNPSTGETFSSYKNTVRPEGGSGWVKQGQQMMQGGFTNPFAQTPAGQQQMGGQALPSRPQQSFPPVYQGPAGNQSQPRGLPPWPGNPPTTGRQSGVREERPAGVSPEEAARIDQENWRLRLEEGRRQRTAQRREPRPPPRTLHVEGWAGRRARPPRSVSGQPSQSGDQQSGGANPGLQDLFTQFNFQPPPGFIDALLQRLRTG